MLESLDELISHAALNKEPIFKAYKRLCRTHGNMDYLHFEWKYYQFYHGSRKSEVMICDLPTDVLEKVFENLEMIDRLSVRRVCQSLRDFIDSSNVNCNEISLNFRWFEPRIQLEKLSIFYKKGGESVYFKNEQFGIIKKCDSSMITDIGVILQNPNLKIGRLEIVFNKEKMNQSYDFMVLLQSLDFQLHVEEICIKDDDYQDMTASILKKLKPGVLRKIDLKMEISKKAQWETLMKMEQWRQAEQFKCYELPDCVPLENLFHFKQMHFEILKTTEEQVKKFRDVLLKSTHFEGMYAKKVRHIWEIICEHPGYDRETYQIAIPNSLDYFQLDSYSCMKFSITRVSDDLYA